MPRKQAQELEEFQLFRAFDAAAEIVAAQPQKCIGISNALRIALSNLAAGNPPEIFASNLHIKLCRTNEILMSMDASSILNYKIGEHGLPLAVAKRAQDVSEYFHLLSLYAKDVGLTYRFDPDTLYGDLWYNSPKGPDFWK